MREFENKVSELFSSMAEICFEYVGRNEKQVDTIFVFGSIDNNRSYNVFDFFYKIDDVYVERHKVNEYLEKQVNNSNEVQVQVQKIGQEDIKNIKKAFEEANQQVPNFIKLRYWPKTGKFDSELIYEELINYEDENNNLLPSDIADQWFEELKAKDE